ncbi:MAG: DUF4136 domain-containing protein [Cytophagales bacterium]|nr:DUF4136 domain-containing protein [Cytophagales bacterium]
MAKRFFILILVATSCAPKAITYLNEEATFQNFNTFRILNTKLDRTNLSKEGRDILDLIELSIRENMIDRGYQESNLSPDLILRYDISTNRRSNSNNNTNASPFTPTVSSSTYFESIILLDLTDAQKKKMFWQSSYDLKQQTKVLKKEQATEDAISEIFYSYPYRASQKKVDDQLADWKTGRKEIKKKRKIEKKEAKKEKKQ